MTFPTVNSSATGATGAGSNVTAQVCNLPATVNDGELLLVVYGGDATGARTATIPSPWVELLDYDGSAGAALFNRGAEAPWAPRGGAAGPALPRRPGQLHRPRQRRRGLGGWRVGGRGIPRSRCRIR